MWYMNAYVWFRMYGNRFLNFSSVTSINSVLMRNKGIFMVCVNQPPINAGRHETVYRWHHLHLIAASSLSFQHDVSQTLLKATLDSIVEECVSFVGVDINICSEVLLR